MSDNKLNNNLQQDIDDLLQNLQRTGRERRKQLKQMSKAGMLQYCVDKSSGGAILDQYPTKKGCENAGYKWKDMRPLTEKVGWVSGKKATVVTDVQFGPKSPY